MKDDKDSEVDGDGKVDDAPGLHAPDDEGIGLENLKRRLDLIYPKKHELTILEEGNVFKVDLKIKTE